MVQDFKYLIRLRRKPRVYPGRKAQVGASARWNPSPVGGCHGVPGSASLHRGKAEGACLAEAVRRRREAGQIMVPRPPAGEAGACPWGSIFGGGVLMLGLAFAEAAPPQFNLSLNQVEKEAFQNSPSLKAAESEWKASQEAAESQFSAMIPRLSLDGAYRYVTEVPEFKPAPASPAVPFGDNKNYSFGPVVSWTAFSSGQLFNRWKSAQFHAKSKGSSFEAAKRQLVLQTRTSYFQVRLALEEVFLVADSLKLAQDQYRDINLRQKAGTLSRIDSLSAHQEVFTRSRELRQSQINLAAALRDLFSLTGLGKELDPSVPWDARLEEKLPLEGESLTLLVRLDPIEKSIQELGSAASAKPDTSHPHILALAEAAEAAHETAKVLKGGHGPTLTLSAKATRDYPNGPVLDPINQKTLGATASLPLFAGNQVVHETRAQEEQALAAQKRRDQASLDLMRDWNQAQDRLKGLKAQQVINEKAVMEAETLAKLVYESYKAGGSIYLDVESANLRVLGTKVIHARTNIQILIQLAILDSLAIK